MPVQLLIYGSDPIISCALVEQMILHELKGNAVAMLNAQDHLYH